MGVPILRDCSVRIVAGTCLSYPIFQQPLIEHMRHSRRECPGTESDARSDRVSSINGDPNGFIPITIDTYGIFGAKLRFGRYSSRQAALTNCKSRAILVR